MPPRDHSDGSRTDVARLHLLARQGELTTAFEQADGEEQRTLLRALYVVVWPITFARITRPVELRRGHHRCAQSFEKLTPECADRFHDDVAAVVHEVMRRAAAPIADLEAWVATATPFATVNGYRRRRGEIGALQRPRLPGWLAKALDDDPWLTRLALHVLEWVGVPQTAGAEVWPINSWTGTRAEATGDWLGSTPERVKCDVRQVLTAMRTRPVWFAAHVERPLGHKQAPIVSAGELDPRPLALVDPHESVEARRIEAARLAMRTIEARLRRGDEPRAAVLDVVRRVFCDGDAAETISLAPHEAGLDDEWLARRLRDDDTAERVISLVLGVVHDAGTAERTA